MNGDRTVLYCRNLGPSQRGVLNLSSPMYSRCLQLNDAGLDALIVGFCDTDRCATETVRDLRVCFVNRRLSGRRMISEIRGAFPECGSIPLVIARDLPSARSSLRVARALGCPAYYDSLETWTGYQVVNGRRAFPDYYRTYLQERRVVRQFKRMVVHSFPAMDYQARLYGLQSDRIGVTYSALPVPDGEGTFPVLGSIGPSDRLLLCSGSLAPRRGLEALVECFAFMPDNYKLLLAGEGPLKGALERRVVERDLHDKVLFQGNVPVTEYYRLIKRADVGIDLRSDSTLNYDLAVSCRVVDYINCGLPVAGSTTRSFRDIEDRLGVIKCLSSGLDPRRRAEEIVRCVDEFLGDTALTARHLQHAMDTEFSYEVNARRFASWLSEDGII